MDPDDERLKVGQKQLVEASAKWKGPSHKERQQESINVKKAPGVGCWLSIRQRQQPSHNSNNKTINPIFAVCFWLQPRVVSFPFLLVMMFADLISIFSGWFQ